MFRSFRRVTEGKLFRVNYKELERYFSRSFETEPAIFRHYEDETKINQASFRNHK